MPLPFLHVANQWANEPADIAELSLAPADHAP